MSSKRGRKRNDNLPPNRARDVQRAFRARRAAHLQALEHRCSELEEENNCLRQALNLPPANRPALGKGPTGKDKPKNFDGNRPQGSHDGSSGDRSPSSSRANSLSPSAAAGGSMRTSPRPTLPPEPGEWGQPMVMPTDPHQAESMLSASANPPYQMQPGGKPVHYPPYSNSITTSSRDPVNGNMYGIPPSQPGYNGGDRSLSGTPGYGSGGNGFILRNESRGEPYPHPPSFPHHDSSAPFGTHSRDNSFPRANGGGTNRNGIGNQFPHLPNPVSHSGMKPPSPSSSRPGTGYGSSDGRLTSLT